MDFVRLSVLFVIVLIAGSKNTAGVNSLEVSSNQSTPTTTTTTTTPNAKATSDEHEISASPKFATKPTTAAPSNVAEKQQQQQQQQQSAKLLPEMLDTVSSPLTNVAATNLSEAKITSITFRSDDGGDSSDFDIKDNTETISFGIRSFTVEVAAPATEKPKIPLDDTAQILDDRVVVQQSAASLHNKQMLDDKVLNEREKVFVADVLTPMTQQQTNRAASAALNDNDNGKHEHDDDDDIDANNDNQMKRFSSNGDGGTNANAGTINASGITIVPVNVATTMHAPATVAAVNHNNENESKSISSNGMQVERKLENGLYRIKIAEIITDEFNNGLHGNDETKITPIDANAQKIDRFESSAMEPPIITMNRYKNQKNFNAGKINIADLYPSPKLDDFSSIIRESNEKLIKEKNQFVGNEENGFDAGSRQRTDDADTLNSRFNIIDDDNEEQNAIRLTHDSEMDLTRQKQQQHTRINGAVNTIENNIPTTKIEIELIDEPATAKDVKVIGPSDDDDDYMSAPPNSDGKVTDFTSKLQENDEVISKIEQSFRESSMSDAIQMQQPPQQQQPSTQSPITINKPINPNPMGFIERRVKKFDPTFKKRLQPLNNEQQIKSQPHIDAALVNIKSSDDFADNTIAVASDNERKEIKGEYPASKLYNGKQSRTKIDDKHTGNDNVNPSKSQAVGKNNKSNENVQKTSGHETNSPKRDSSAMPTISSSPLLDLKSGADQKILFINVNKNGNNNQTNQKEMDRLQRDRQQIIKDSQISINQSKSTNNATPTPTINMHLRIIHDEDVDLKPLDTIKTNQKKTNNEMMVTPTPTTVEITTTTVAASIKDNDAKTPTTPAVITTAAVGKTSVSVEQQKTTSNNPSTATDDTTESTVIGTTESNSQQYSSSSIAIKSPTEHPADFEPANSATTILSQQPASHQRILSRLQEKINALECDIQAIATDSTVWRGNETHELNLPTTTPENCSVGADCMPMIISWEGAAEIQSGDVLIVEIDDTLLMPADINPNANTNDINGHKATTAVYQVTRPGHEHCDATEGILLDITPLVVDGKKLVTLYDKDLTEGVNLLIVVSDLWGPQCVRLKVTVKSDNCGEGAECSGKGVCFSNTSMEGYECQCCIGFAGSHCEEIDACSPSPCTNNGICVDLSQGHDGNSYQCLCPYGYSGKNCQFESDPCQNGECQNGGTCTGNSTHFRCECASGFTGPLCQHNLNECESSPCVHGICVDQEDGFRCFCQPGFAGELCNFEYNECDSNPCLNNGQCTDHIGGFSCKCTRGYTGKRCHIKVDFCANNPCPDGRQCNDHGNDFSCDCPEGRNGPDCSVPRTKCNVNPCANGGTCWTSDESFYCACRAGFTGKMCEDEFILDAVVSSNEILSDSDSATTHARPFGESTFSAVVSKGTTIGLHNAYIAVGTFATAIFIVAIVVIVCHCKFHKSYRRFTTRQHQLIPIFGFGRRAKQLNNPRHWLSGKGHMNNATNKTASTTTLNQSNLSNNNANLNGCHSGPTSLPNYHLQNSNYQPPRFQRHLAMNLENDMYYTVDFSDSQHSPLIH